MMEVNLEVPHPRYNRYADDWLIALLPGHEKAERDIVPEVENLMNDLHLTLNWRLETPSLRIDVSINAEGNPHFKAPAGIIMERLEAHDLA
jgi:hypothetical protein